MLVRIIFNFFTFMFFKFMLNYQNITKTLEERFKKYVQIDTQSDPGSATTPSTAKQKNLGKVLVEELLAMGIN